MKCFQCGRSGYPHTFQTSSDGKNWCGKCDTNGFITKTGVAAGQSAFAPTSSPGGLESLPKIATLSEWREVVAICKKVGSPNFLLEELPFKTPSLAKPSGPNKPPKSNDGWMPLTEYYKAMENPKPTSKVDVRNLFG